MAEDQSQRSENAFSVARLPDAMTPPGEELRWRLERFLEVVQGLTRSPLFTSPSIGLNLVPRGDELFDVECVTPVDDFEMRGMLTYFRHLWLSGEPAQFGRLRGDLRHHVEASGLPASAELVGWLDGVGRADRVARRSFPDFSVLEAETSPVGVVRDETVRAERIIDDWVNGEVFHSDAQQKARIDWAGDVEAYRFALLAAVQEVTKPYVLFGRMVKAILSEPALQ